MRTKVTSIRQAEAPESQENTYILRLFITGSTPHSVRSIFNVRRLCEECLLGRYNLEVIDIYQQPELARQEQIVAAPTLIKKSPLPFRMLVGDLSDQPRVMAGLDLKPERK